MSNENIFVICIAIVLVWYYFWVYKEGKKIGDLFGEKKETPAACVTQPTAAVAVAEPVATTETYANDARSYRGFDFSEKSLSGIMN
jgi:hypothetical protein